VHLLRKKISYLCTYVSICSAIVALFEIYLAISLELKGILVVIMLTSMLTCIIITLFLKIVEYDISNYQLSLDRIIEDCLYLTTYEEFEDEDYDEEEEEINVPKKLIKPFRRRISFT